MNYSSWFSGISALLISVVIFASFLFLWNVIFKSKPKRNSPKLNNKVIVYSLIGILLFFMFYCDFLRDFLFQNLEQQMRYAQRVELSKSPSEIVNFTDKNFISAFGHLSANEAYLYKYVFFGIFTAVYYIICSLILFIAYPNLSTTKFVSFLYGVGISSMLVIFSLYFFPWNQEVKNGFYLISMEIGHFFQSSLPTLLLLVSFKIYQNYPTENTR